MGAFAIAQQLGLVEADTLLLFVVPRTLTGSKETRGGGHPFG